MEYIGNQCPVCEKIFQADDDIVVCPECGTPHHRECYESLGHCCHEEIHHSGYDYNADAPHQDAPRVTQCPVCGKDNDPDAFFCKYCATPLKSQENPRHGPGTPFVGGPFRQQDDNSSPLPFMDPLAGIPAETHFGDGVTAGETAKYVKQNTPYYIRVFNTICIRNQSKFNFSAAIFSGGFLLYRKMYKIGAFITAVQAALLILSIYVQIAYDSLFTQMTESLRVSTTNFFDFFAKLSNTEMLILMLPDITNIINIAIMLVIGFTFNRLYFKHCRQEIQKIKGETPQNENPETVLQTKGGVNMPLAISLLVTYFIISYLPSIISAFL